MKNGWTDDRESTARTLDAMEYNIQAKQRVIDKLIAENQELENENRRLKEENAFLEYLRETSIN